MKSKHLICIIELHLCFFIRLSNQGTKNSLKDLFINFWKKSFNFTGTINRGDFWKTIGSLFLVGIPLHVVMVLFIRFVFIPPNCYTYEGYCQRPMNIIIGWVIFFIFSPIIPMFSMSLRRLRDIGKAPEWILLILLPIVGSLILIFWFARPTII